MYLSIDPSINDVGVCWYHPTLKEYTWTLIKPPKEFELPLKMWFIKKQLDKGLDILDSVTELICEYPQFFNNERGATAATKGYTLDLACICGYMAGICKFAKVYYYTPNEWKGQQTKHAIEGKFTRLFSEDLPTDHEYEATMMMRHHLLTEYPHEQL